jgi:hypothetical protein
MTTYIPDPIERGEARAEAAYDEMIQPEGKWKCPCGRIYDPKEEGENYLYPDPYAPPSCGQCAEEYFKSNAEAMPSEE